MAVNYTSRYYETATDRYIALRKDRPTTRYYTYTASSWDSFDLLAHRVLGDAALYWVVADLNPHVPFPDRIPPGTELRIPV